MTGKERNMAGTEHDRKGKLTGKEKERQEHDRKGKGNERKGNQRRSKETKGTEMN